MHKFNINCSCLGEPDNKIISSAYARAPAKQLGLPKKQPKWDLYSFTINLSMIKSTNFDPKKLLWGQPDLMLNNFDML